MELADVDACDGVSGLEVIHFTRDEVFTDRVECEVEIGNDIQMLGIEEATLGATRVLAGQMVVVLVAQPLHIGTVAAFAGIQ